MTYAIPIVNGVKLDGNTDFLCDGNSAVVNLIVLKEEHDKNLDDILSSRPNYMNTLSVQFTSSQKEHVVFDACNISIQAVDSKYGDSTKITLKITNKDSRDEPFIRRIQP
jgi:hypothetical protein